MCRGPSAGCGVTPDPAYRLIVQEAQGLLKSGGGFEINDYEDFEGLMSKLMNDEAFLKQAGDEAGAFVASLSGATDKVLAKVTL